MPTKANGIGVLEKPASVADELELTLEDLKILQGMPDTKNQLCRGIWEDCTNHEICCSRYCNLEYEFCLG